MLLFIFILSQIWFRGSCITQENHENTSDSIFPSEAVNPQIQEVLWHMRSSRTGFPGLPIPDPMAIPDVEHEVEYKEKKINFKFENSSITGLSSFTVDTLVADFVDFGIKINLTFTELLVQGNYSMNCKIPFLPSEADGTFSIRLITATISGEVNLTTTDDGKIQIGEVILDINVRRIKVEIKNLVAEGFASYALNFFLSSIGKIMFANIKPNILSQLQNVAKQMANDYLLALPPEPLLLAYLKPLDTIIDQAAQEIQKRGFDPYNLPSHERGFQKDLFFMTARGTASLSDGYIKGLSTLHRHGNVIATFTGNSLYLLGHMGFDTLEGGYQWSVSFLGLQKTGAIHFKVESLQLKVQIRQENEKGSYPTLDILEIEGLKNIQTDIDGLGSFNLILEFILNLITNVFKDHLKKVIQGPIMNIIQENLKSIKLPF